MTEKEKQQLKQDIKSGKVDIYELYEKYGIHLPSIRTYEQSKEENPNITPEEYEANVLSDKITILFWQMGWEGLDIE